MCDYSLETFKSVEAVVGETYILHRFATGTVGFARPADVTPAGICTTAVCMKTGCKLDLINSVGKTKTAEFIRIDTPLVYGHHDGVRYSDGVEVLLQHLSGLTARIHESLEERLGLDLLPAMAAIPAAGTPELLDAD